MSTRCIESREGAEAESFEHDAEFVRPLIEIADAKRCASAQLALARLFAQGPDVAPMPGPRAASQRQNLAALSVLPRRGKPVSRAINDARVKRPGLSEGPVLGARRSGRSVATCGT
jgi:aryl-alcohol dehydrogenase-like predicted oxidoreductase